MRRLLGSAAVLAIGGAVAGGLFWALLNVPESNVPALLLSVLLVALVAVTAWATGGVAAHLDDRGSLAGTAGRSIKSLPAMMLAAAVFIALWWTTGAANEWWRLHQGETDAMFIARGMTNTAWLHVTMNWLLWFVRWVVGSSLVLGVLVATTREGLGRTAGGLRLALRALPLLAATVGALVIDQGIWRLAFWRPEGLPASWVEAGFAAGKLSLLYVAAALVGAVVLWIYRRSLTSAA